MLAFSTLRAPLPLRGAYPVAVRGACPLVNPATPLRPLPASSPPRRRPTMALDPHLAHSVHTAASHALNGHPHLSLDSLSLLLSDAAAATDAAASAAADVATESTKTGLWNSFVNIIESSVVTLHDLLAGAGVPGAYGFSIILFTLAIKVLTFPLNYRQMESTMKMQALAPRLRKIQADYKDNPAVMNQMTAELYKSNNVNPLAGCLPVFAQIPVWIALYRSVLNLAADNLLDEPFLWVPSLQGPVAKTGEGLKVWLFPLVDGAPPIGWHDAACYLVLPIILVASQFYSQRIMTPPSSDPQSQQANNFLKFMPLLIGWFSLNVPSGLGVYWVTNNVLSTAQTLYIRSQFPQLANKATASGSDDGEDEPDDVVDGFKSAMPTKSASAGKSTKSKKRRKRR